MKKVLAMTVAVLVLVFAVGGFSIYTAGLTPEILQVSDEPGGGGRDTGAG